MAIPGKASGIAAKASTGKILQSTKPIVGKGPMNLLQQIQAQNDTRQEGMSNREDASILADKRNQEGANYAKVGGAIGRDELRKNVDALTNSDMRYKQGKIGQDAADMKGYQGALDAANQFRANTGMDYGQAEMWRGREFNAKVDAQNNAAKFQAAAMNEDTRRYNQEQSKKGMSSSTSSPSSSSPSSPSSPGTSPGYAQMRMAYEDMSDQMLKDAQRNALNVQAAKMMYPSR
jgi:hypothetical protein